MGCFIKKNVSVNNTKAIAHPPQPKKKKKDRKKDWKKDGKPQRIPRHSRDVQKSGTA